MDGKKQQHIFEKTEKEVLKWLPATTSTQLFELRVEIGLDYIYSNYPQREHKQVMNSKEWWNWFRMVWQMNDRIFLRNIRRDDDPDFRLYEIFHGNESGKYYLSRTLQRAILSPETDKRAKKCPTCGASSNDEKEAVLQK